MLMTDIRRVVDQISRDKGIEPTVLVQALEEALKSAAKKKFGSRIDIEVKYSEEAGEIEVFQFKEVVEEVIDPEIEISLEEGIALDPDCDIGDCLGTKMDTATFGRIAAQSAKQVIIQKMKDAERNAVYDSFISRKGEIINGILQRYDRNNIIVNLGHADAVLPTREQTGTERYKRGDRIRALIMDVRNDAHGPQVILSRSHPDFLINLFRTEVPEISEGLVSIVGAAREAGKRSKIAVASNDSDVDPVGACVGMQGSRVKNVVMELNGEKIDIIPWHVDPAKYVCNALAPAKISRVIIDEDNRTMEVIVPDEDLSSAIGARGQNVRLASRLTRWRLDVKSETNYSKAMKDGYNSLISLEGVGIATADALYENGFYSAKEISESTLEDLMQIRNLSEEEAERIIAAARTYLEEEAEKTAEEEAPAEPAEVEPDEAGAAAAASPAEEPEEPEEPEETESQQTAEADTAEPPSVDEGEEADDTAEDETEAVASGETAGDEVTPADAADRETSSGEEIPAEEDVSARPADDMPL